MVDGARVRDLFETLLAGELVPFVSLWIVVGAIVVSGFDYAVVVQSATLLFYAVLVGIWTSLAPTAPLEEGGNYAQLEFLMISSAAVVVGFGIESALQQLSGRMYAVQALALAFLGSRLYVNAIGTSGFAEMFRLHRPSERYLVYLPCLVGLVLPAVAYQFGVETLFGYGLDTREAVGFVAAGGLLLGAVAYLAVEVVAPRAMR